MDSARLTPRRGIKDVLTPASDALRFAVPLYNFGVSQHFKTWVDMVITQARRHGRELGAAAATASPKAA